MNRKSLTLLVAIPLVAAIAGCAGSSDRHVPSSAPADPIVLVELQRARELFRDERYRDAERAFSRLSDPRRHTLDIVTEATFFHAESLFHQGKHVDAHKLYRRLLTNYRRSDYFEAAVRRSFQIGTKFCTGEASTFWRGKRFGAKVLEEVLKDSPYGPYSAQARLQLAEHYYNRGRYFDSIRHCDLLAAHYGNAREVAPARYLKALASYHTLRGNRYDGTQVDDAIANLEEARILVMAQPESTKRTEQIGDLESKIMELRHLRARESFDLAQFFIKNGNRAAALLSLQQVIQYAPESPQGERARKLIEDMNGDTQR